MIEFGLKHKHSSGWHKKFPRQKIEHEDPMHLGMHEHLRFRNEWLEGRDGYLSWKDLEKFFEANLGKNVDNVFSEFVNRAKRFNHDVSLREKFFKALDPDQRWPPKYTIDSQNRIVKYVREESKDITSSKAEEYNKAHLPASFKPFMKENELTYVGDFYVRGKGWKGKWQLVPVFITNKDWYETVMQIGFGKEYVKYSNMTNITISIPKSRSGYSEDVVGVPSRGYEIVYKRTGKSVEFNGYTFELERPVQMSYTTRKENADYIFLVKGLNWDAY